MRIILLRQAIVIPILSWIVLISVGITVSGYSSLSEQASALGLLTGYPAISEMVCAGAIGLSILLFSVGLIHHPFGRFPFTIFAAVMFGLSMLSNAVFKMGSPLHGMYAIGFTMVLLPLLFTVELNDAHRTKGFTLFSKWVAVLTLAYFWLTISGFDPEGYQGLTQRIGAIPIFAWFSYAGMVLLRSQARGSQPSRRSE